MFGVIWPHALVGLHAWTETALIEALRCWGPTFWAKLRNLSVFGAYSKNKKHRAWGGCEGGVSLYAEVWGGYIQSLSAFWDSQNPYRYLVLQSSRKRAWCTIQIYSNFRELSTFDPQMFDFWVIVIIINGMPQGAFHVCLPYWVWSERSTLQTRHMLITWKPVFLWKEFGWSQTAMRFIMQGNPTVLFTVSLWQ